MSSESGVSLGKSWYSVQEKIERLPHCFDITRKYCSGYTGILLVDGKYLRVVPYERKIPVLYGVDYLSHDIPGYRLVPSESYTACLKFFSSLKLAGYNLIALVCDDNRNIYQACLKVYPKAIIQLCTKHFISSVYETLDVVHYPQYGRLVKQIAEIFRYRRGKQELELRCQRLYQEWKADEPAKTMLLEIARRLPLLTGYMNYPNIPLTTNLIEGLNSHLEKRLTGIRKFQSYKTADSWLNAYFIRRRLTTFTDCGRKFHRLNGTCSIQHVLKNETYLEKLQKLIA